MQPLIKGNPESDAHLEVPATWHGPLWARPDHADPDAPCFTLQRFAGSVAKRRFLPNAFAAYMLCDKPEHGMACRPLPVPARFARGGQHIGHAWCLSRKRRGKAIRVDCGSANWWILSPRPPAGVAAR